MELTEQEVELIEAYLNDTLRGDELAMFQVRVEQDKAFAEEVLLHKQITAGVTQFGAKSMKAELAAIGADMAANNAFAEYNPSVSNLKAEKGKKSSGNSFGTMLTILGAASLAAAAYVWQTGGFTGEHIKQDLMETSDGPTLQGDAPEVQRQVLQGPPAYTYTDSAAFRQADTLAAPQ